MLRWLRFLFYSALLWFSLISHAPAIRLSLRLLEADRYFAAAVPCVGCALAVLLSSSVYAVWLGGATVAGWRLPLAVNAIPLALLAVTFLRGPLQPTPGPDDALGPAERAQAAEVRLLELASALPGDPCAERATLEAQLNATPKLPSSGLWSYGRRVPFSVRAFPSRQGPVQELGPADQPGTLLLACSDSGRYWISVVVADAVPIGHPAVLRDGVGKMVVYRGQREGSK